MSWAEYIERQRSQRNPGPGRRNDERSVAASAGAGVGGADHMGHHLPVPFTRRTILAVSDLYSLRLNQIGVSLENSCLITGFESDSSMR